MADRKHGTGPATASAAPTPGAIAAAHAKGTEGERQRIVAIAAADPDSSLSPVAMGAIEHKIGATAFAKRISHRPSDSQRASAPAGDPAQLAAARAEGGAAEQKRILAILDCDPGAALTAASSAAIQNGTAAGDFAAAVIKGEAGGNRGKVFMMKHRGQPPRGAGASTGNRGLDLVQTREANSRGNIHERIEAMRGSVPGLPKR